MDFSTAQGTFWGTPQKVPCRVHRACRLCCQKQGLIATAIAYRPLILVGIGEKCQCYKITIQIIPHISTV